MRVFGITIEAMDYKPLGDVGVDLPEIGLGTSEYTGGVEPLRRGVDLGATLIDTAELYRTEVIVGEAIRGMRDRVFLATKVSPLHFRRRALLNAAENSLKALGTDYIDLYQLHWSNPLVSIGETMAAMEQLVDSGKVRFIGVSNFSVRRLKKAQAAMTRHKIVSNQVGYSLVDRRIEPGLLSYCQQNGITVIAYSPLGTGMNHLQARDRASALAHVAAETGKTEAQVALNWCISKENVIAIPKSNSLERIQENCDASGWRLTAEQIKALDEGIRPYGQVDYIQNLLLEVVPTLRRSVRRYIRRRR